jgi:tetratricopeptide (TPR) repeat protein
MILQIIEGGTETLAEGPSSAVVLQAKTLLGDIMEITLEEVDETLALRREVIAVIDEGAKVSREYELDSRVKLADTLMSSHALSGLKASTEPIWKEATGIITEILPIAEEELGSMHPVLVDARLTLSGDYYFSGQVMESIALAEQCYEDAKKIYGLKHLKTARAAATLGGFMAMVQHPYTETVIKEAIAIYKSIVGDSHPMLIMSNSSLGQFYARDERYAEAEKVLREAVELSIRLSAGKIYRMQASASLAYALLLQGKFDEAEPLWQEAIDSIVESMGIDSQAYGSMQYTRAFGYVLNDHPDVDETVDDFIAFALKTHGANDSHVQLVVTKLCFAYFDTGKYERGSTIMTDLIKEVRGDPSSTDEELSNVLELESKLVGKYVENSYSPAVAIEILNRIIPELQKQWEPTSIEMVILEVMRSQVLLQLGQNEESVTLFAALHKRVVDSLGHKDSITEMVAVQRTNNLIFLDRWSEADELVQENFNRNYSDADYLMEWAKEVITNGHDGYRDRYLGLALEATERAVSIRGEDNPDATYRLAGVHAARGEYEEALNWMTKTIAFAGEDHEKIEKFREKLDQLNTLIKTGTLDIQPGTFED